MIVYKITNKINNNFYIGVTNRNLERRLYEHAHYERDGVGQAIKKYGKQNFIIEQIDTAKTPKELDKKEKHYIKTLKPKYNLTTGGSIFFQHTNYVKQKLSKIMSKKLLGNQNRKGLTFTKEQRRKISESLKGHPKTNFGGYKLSKEFKEKARLRWLGDNNIAKRPDVREKLRLAALKREARKRELKKVI